MRISTPLLAALAATGGLSAQITQDSVNECFDHDTVVQFYSFYGTSGTVDDWVTNHYPREFYRGQCQMIDRDPASPTNGQLIGRIGAVRIWNQDNDNTTIDEFGVGMFAENAAAPGEPDINTPLFSARGFNTPPSLTAPSSFIWTLTLTPPFDGVPQDADVFLGGFFVQDPAKGPRSGGPGGSPDGWVQILSNIGIGTVGGFYSTGYTADPNFPFYDIAQSYEDQGGGVFNTRAGNFSERWPAIWGLTPALVMKLGKDTADPRDDDPAAGISYLADQYNYGVDAMFPDYPAGQDGLAFRLESRNLVGISVTHFVVASLGVPYPMGTGNTADVFSTIGPIPILAAGTPWEGGNYWGEIGLLQNYDWLVGQGVGDTSGDQEILAFPQGAVTSAIGDLVFQSIALGVDPGTGSPISKVSNAQRMHSL